MDDLATLTADIRRLHELFRSGQLLANPLDTLGLVSHIFGALGCGLAELLKHTHDDTTPDMPVWTTSADTADFEAACMGLHDDLAPQPIPAQGPVLQALLAALLAELSKRLPDLLDQLLDQLLKRDDATPQPE